MWDYIQSSSFQQFFAGHPDRVFALILILCATLVLIVAALSRKRPLHHHFHDNYTQVLGSGLTPGVYMVDEYRRLYRIPDPVRYFAPPKPSHDQKFIDEYFDFMEGLEQPAPKPQYSTAKASRRPKMSGSKRMRILRRDGFRCQMCGRKATDEEGLALHIDHKMPVSKGGGNDDDNLWVLCNECNEAKSDTVMEELFETADSDASGEEAEPDGDQ